MNITRENIKETLRNIMAEESEYQTFFKKALEKTGKSIPSMSDEEKKEFFNKIDAAWSAKGEKNEGNAFGAAVTAAKEKGEDEFEVGGKTYKVESVVNEDANMNKKVKQLLDKNLKELTKGKPNHQFAVMHILMGALSDANFHSEAKQVAKLFPKAKYEGDPMAAKDVEEYYHYELGPDVANICKWDGKDIVDAIGFYVSMTIGRPVGEKVEKLVESVNESNDCGCNSVNEGKVHFEKKLKSGNIFQVIDRDTKGMRGTQDKFSMQIVDKKGKVVKHIGSHPSLSGAKKFSNSLNEGKHDVMLDKLASIVKGVNFMNVGKELKKNGIKYSFSTSMIPMYKIDKLPIAIVNKKYAAGAEREVGDIAIGLLESINEADVVGKTIFSDGKGKLFFGYYKTDDAVEFVDYKTWKKLNFKDVSKGDTNKDRLINAILKKQKQFNKKVEFNMWAKQKKRTFEETMDWFIQNGWINNINKSGIKEIVTDVVSEGRAFVAAAKKAKEEGKTEFEFNGKTYPVTLKEEYTQPLYEIERGDIGYVEKYKSIATVYDVMGKKVKVKLGKTGKTVVIDTNDIKVVSETVNKDLVSERRLGKVSLLRSVEKGDTSYVEGVKISPELAFELRMFLERPMLARTRTGIAIDNSQMKDVVPMLAKLGIHKRLSSGVKGEFANLLKKYAK